MEDINFWPIVLSLLTIISITCAQNSPNITSISEQQIRNIGDPAELTCTVEDASDHPVLWLKLGRNYPTFISTGSSLVFRDERFNIKNHHSSSNYTLEIKNLEESDTGIYQCQIVLGVNTRVTATVQLIVRTPPVITENSTKSLVVTRGDPATLECYAEGVPRPSIFWARQKNKTLPVGGHIFVGNVINISSVEKENRGTYYCLADNGAVDVARQNVVLEVEFAPEVTLNETENVSISSEAVLVCRIEAYPAPNVTWIYDEKELNNNENFEITHSTISDEVTESTLSIKSIKENNFGEYICSGENKWGRSSQRVQVQEDKGEDAATTDSTMES